MAHRGKAYFWGVAETIGGAKVRQSKGSGAGQVVSGAR